MRKKIRTIKLLLLIIVIIGSGFGYYYSRYIAPDSYSIKKTTITNNSVPDEFKNFDIGFISDIEIDWCGKCIQAIVVEKYSFFKLLCFFKEAPCIVIPIECVVSIGGDVILVSIEP